MVLFSSGSSSVHVPTVLAGTRLFQKLEKGALKSLANIAILKGYDRATVVCRQDEPKPGVFVLVRGSARAFVISESGREHVTRLLAPGEVFAEMATLGDFACPAAVETLRPSQVLLLPAAELDRFLEQHPAACRQLLSSVAQETGRIVRQATRLTLLDAHSRVAAFLISRNGDVRWGKRHVASHLGLTSETFSRVLRRLADSGLIDLEGDGPVRILDPHGLSKVSLGNELREPEEVSA